MHTHADDREAAENADITELSHTPLYVSLGSVCEVAHVLRACELRKAAFPFDWITSIDSEKFLEVLDSDFQDFLNEEYLYGVEVDPGPLLHTYYHLEFLHEGDFRTPAYAMNMEKLQTKYLRRVERFRQLSEYGGKVIFLRTAYSHSLDDPHRYYFCEDNLEINDDFSQRLYSILRRTFPSLDFTLIIINNGKSIQPNESLVEEKRLAQNLIKIRVNFTDVDRKTHCFRSYFDSLAAEGITRIVQRDFF